MAHKTRRWVSVITGMFNKCVWAGKISVSNHPRTKASAKPRFFCRRLVELLEQGASSTLCTQSFPDPQALHGTRIYVLWLLSVWRFISCGVSKLDVLSLQYRGSFAKSLYSVPAKYLILTTSPMSHVQRRCLTVTR